jgi:hypothetical protein
MPVDAHRLKASGVYQATLPLPQLAADLAQIEQFVNGWIVYRKRLNQLGLLLLPIGVVLLILGIVNDIGILIGLAIPMFFVAIGLFFYSALYARDCCKRFHRVRLMRDLANIINDDANPKKPVTLDLAFKERKELLAEEPWPERKKGRQKFFKDRWAAFHAELLDETAFSQEIVDVIRERTYANPRGKTKRKRRNRHFVSTRLAYSPEIYGDVSRSPALLVEGIRVPPSARFRGCKITDRDIKLKAQLDRPEDLKDTCVMLALGGYRILNYARAVRGRAQGRAS